MQLFNVINNNAQPTTEVLLIYPFKDIWERDITPHRNGAIREFTYIEFMCSPKKTNPFYGYIDLEKRAKKIKENLFSKENVEKLITWKADDLILEGIKVYTEFIKNASPALNLLDSCYTAAKGIENFLNTENVLTKTNGRGMPLYKPVDIMRAIKEMEGIVKSLNGLREKVEQELYETSKTRGNRKTNRFEE